MAAVINLHPRTSVALDPVNRPARERRPHLVLVEGGRSELAQARRRRYALRRVVAAAGVCVLVGAAVMTVLGVVTAVTTAEPIRELPTSYVVAPGETMWGIARSLDLDIDVRVVVDELSAANGGSRVRAGQTLIIADALDRL